MTEKYFVVHFHADGGQMCIPGRRVFTDRVAADQFADRMLADTDHYCTDHTRVVETDTPVDSCGDIYTYVDPYRDTKRHWTR